MLQALHAAPDGQRCGTLVVGFVNLMSGEAAAQSERQFRSLVQSAACKRRIVWRRVPLPGEGAGDPEPFGNPQDPLDTLIVTGAEPRADTLQNERFWSGLCRLLDQAKARAMPVVLSCLASHAALLHAAGVVRRRLPAKRSGVLVCHPATSHVMLAGLPDPLLVPHSRCNEITVEALRAAGFIVLTQTGAGDVDMALSEGAAPWLLLQGHPEYDAGTLLREYRRDLARHIALGGDAAGPALPTGVLEPNDAVGLLALPPAERLAAIDPCGADDQDAPWSEGARAVFANWFDLVESRRPRRCAGHAVKVRRPDRPEDRADVAA